MYIDYTKLDSAIGTARYMSENFSYIAKRLEEAKGLSQSFVGYKDPHYSAVAKAIGMLENSKDSVDLLLKNLMTDIFVEEKPAEPETKAD